MDIIHTDQLEAIINENNVVLVDSRGGADAYERYMHGHLAGALFADLETNLSSKSDDPAQGGRHPLPEPRDFGTFVAGLGISSSSTVIVYDDKKGANAAARFWWMLKAAGHEKVYVISGGLDSLSDKGYEIITGQSPVSTPVSEYILESWKFPLFDANKVSAVSKDENYLIIDVRENYRYQGQSEPIDLIAGHIPGAINIPYTSNLDENGAFLSSAVLAETYKSLLKGVKPENVIVHCGSGVTACHTLLALSEAGMPGAGLYVGSWSEWSRNDRPLALGNNP